MKKTFLKSTIIMHLFFCFSFFFAYGHEIALIDVAKELNSVLYWDPLTGSGILEKDTHHISFSVYSNIVLVDYKIVRISDAPEIHNGELTVSHHFVDTLKKSYENFSTEEHFRIGAILIDAGHGGKDPGAIGTHVINGKKISLQEKDIVLFVAKDLHAQLQKAYPDKKILLTRDDDRFLSLSERTDIANKVKLAKNEAIVYVSIHANAGFDKRAKGFEVWYLSPGYRRTLLQKNTGDKVLTPILNSMLEEEFTTESILIAKYIEDGLEAQVGSYTKSRGLKEEEWFVVKNAHMPSVLVELGFVTNLEEATLLADKNYLRKISLGIYNGLVAFVTHFEDSRGFTGQ